MVIVDTALGPVYVLKSNVSNGSYQILLQPGYAPKLVLVFPSAVNGYEMEAIPLTLSMVWKNSPPIFYMATETVANLANTALRCNRPYCLNKMDNRAKSVVIDNSWPL